MGTARDEDSEDEDSEDVKTGSVIKDKNGKLVIDRKMY